MEREQHVNAGAGAQGEPIRARLALETASAEETLALGAALGARLGSGQGLALSGPMGAGKTVLARGIAAGLGVEGAEEVVSPSYLLMIEYPGPIPFYHFDAYFAAKGHDFLADGGEVLLEGAGVALIEWAERLGERVPAHFLKVSIGLAPEGGDRRTLEFEGSKEEWGEFLAELAGEFLA